jgi:hypothetical protein
VNVRRYQTAGKDWRGWATCPDCGAVTNSTKIHDSWHARVDTQRDQQRTTSDQVTAPAWSAPEPSPLTTISPASPHAP